MSDLLDRTKAVLSPLYTVEREIGRGGMATVFLATDRKHNRAVAVKVLHPELAAVIGGERFLREINIAAHLQHPHIVPLLDSGEVDGLLYYVMPYVEGESLRRRLARAGRLDIPEAARYWRDVVDAIAHAHRQKVLHRDIKPENVMIAERHASVVDFGVGKAIDSADTNEALTRLGVIVGTPLYMAPEQAMADEQVDHRSDIYALGILAYEMLLGHAPFAALSPAAQFANKATAPAPDVREERPEVPLELARAVGRCLESDPERRFQSADELLATLESISTPGSGATGVALRAERRPRRARTMAIALGALLVIGGGGTIWYGRGGERRWAEREGLPALRRLAGPGPTAPTDSAFLIAQRVRAAMPGNAEADTLWRRVSSPISLKTRPPGAHVWWTAYRGDTSSWHLIGTTPIDSVAVPAGRAGSTLLLKLEQPGFRTAVRLMGTERGRPFADLDSTSSPDSGMVLVRGARILIPSAQHAEGDQVPVPDFLIGRYEVTNREFKAFVAGGGYQRKDLWDLPIRDAEGHEVPWDIALAKFRDRTGRPGPATWEAGDIPAGKEEFPVAGITWYEARAYARFAGRELPTIHHWRLAARRGPSSISMVPGSNVQGAGLARAGTFTGMTPFGAFDMAGNVREWCVNATGGLRYILGGSWQEASYIFGEAHTADPMDRSETNGMRLMRLKTDSARATLATLSAPAPRGFRDYSRERPVSDAQFRSFLPLFDYDKAPLNASIVATDTTDRRWTMQTIEFDAAYGQERVRAYLYLPRNAKPPYQSVVFYPGSNSLDERDIRRAQALVPNFDFLVTTGRAVILPIYKDTYDRKTESVNLATDPVYNMSGGLLGPNTYRDHVIMDVKDLRRAVDYLFTRTDVDTARLAYSGYSWGARLAAINLAVEPRFKVAVLALPGLMFAPRRPEVDELNFLPHVTVPVLTMSGRFDGTFPYETAVVPYLKWLGVAPAQLRQRVYPTLHFLPRDEHIRETLDWLDKYLGKVTSAP